MKKKIFAITWSFSGIAYALSFILLGYISFYCTDTLGLSPGLVGFLLLLSKIADGISDLIAGVLIERCHSKYGKARPFIWCMAISWIFIILLFSTPSFGNIGKAIYIFTIYFITTTIFITLSQTAEPVFLARSLEDTSDSANVLAISGMIITVISTIAGIIFPLMLTMWGEKPYGWTIISIIFAIPSIILTAIKFFLIKEKKSGIQVSREKMSFSDTFKVFGNNPQVIALILAQVLANIFSGITNTSMTYYFKYIIGDISMQSLVSMVGLISPFFMIMIPLLTRKISLIKLVRAVALLGFIGNAMKIFANGNIMILMLAQLLCSAASIPTAVLLPSFLIDCMDYNEWKTGNRVEGIFGAMNGFAMKFGGGLSSIIIGVVLALGGYDGAVLVQSESANNAIIILFAVIPSLLFLGIYAAFKKYKISEEMPKIQQELAKKKQ